MWSEDHPEEFQLLVRGIGPSFEQNAVFDATGPSNMYQSLCLRLGFRWYSFKHSAELALLGGVIMKTGESNGDVVMVFANISVQFHSIWNLSCRNLFSSHRSPVNIPADDSSYPTIAPRFAGMVE